MKTRTCSRCHQARPRDQFEGAARVCRPCREAASSPTGERACSGCGETKPSTEFDSPATTRCAECRRAYQRKYHRQYRKQHPRPERPLPAGEAEFRNELKILRGVRAREEGHVSYADVRREWLCEGRRIAMANCIDATFAGEGGPPPELPSYRAYAFLLRKVVTRGEGGLTPEERRQWDLGYKVYHDYAMDPVDYIEAWYKPMPDPEPRATDPAARAWHRIRRLVARHGAVRALEALESGLGDQG